MPAYVHLGADHPAFSASSSMPERTSVSAQKSGAVAPSGSARAPSASRDRACPRCLLNVTKFRGSRAPLPFAAPAQGGQSPLEAFRDCSREVPCQATRDRLDPRSAWRARSARRGAAGWMWRPAVLFHGLERGMQARIGRIGAAFPPGALHTVAIKANPSSRSCGRRSRLRRWARGQASLEEVETRARRRHARPAASSTTLPAKSAPTSRRPSAWACASTPTTLLELGRIDELISLRGRPAASGCASTRRSGALPASP